MTDTQTDAVDFWRRRCVTLTAELAAAQAKFALPVDDDAMFDAEYLRHSAEQLNTTSPTCLRNIADRHESLARDNAALRTQAEALERERDAYKGMLELERGALLAAQAWMKKHTPNEHSAARENYERDMSHIARILAEKP